MNKIKVGRKSNSHTAWTASLLLLLVLFSGCATITRGTNEVYVIESTPAGAEVQSSTGWTCTTPCSVKVKRKGEFSVTISKEGYVSVTTNVSSSVDGGGAAGMAGNVILGGLIGAGVDAGSGAMHSHKPNPLMVELVPLAEPVVME
ncbi:MAG: PEGA domain-containing protein [Pseudomonadota bacterium]